MGSHGIPTRATGGPRNKFLLGIMGTIFNRVLGESLAWVVIGIFTGFSGGVFHSGSLKGFHSHRKNTPPKSQTEFFPLFSRIINWVYKRVVTQVLGRVVNRAIGRFIVQVLGGALPLVLKMDSPSGSQVFFLTFVPEKIRYRVHWTNFSHRSSGRILQSGSGKEFHSASWHIAHLGFLKD